MVLGYIGVFFGRLLQAAVSRHRERLADASAVQFTRNPGGLTGALLKIAGVSSGSRLVKPEAEEVAHMLFAAGLPRLMATHPSLEERLKALDPSFRPAELPALAAAAARDAQKMRAGGCRRETGEPARPAVSRGAFVQGAAIGALASDAAAIVAQAGTLANEQVRYAEQARACDPGAATRLRRLRRSCARAGAGIAGEQGTRRSSPRSGAFWNRPTVRNSARTCWRNSGTADSLAPQLRLPAVQQLFPSLRRLTLGRAAETARRGRDSLRSADSRIDVFECCLTLLLASSLYDELEAGAQHGSASLLQEADAIHVLFCVLAAQGTADAALARPRLRGGHLRGAAAAPAGVSQHR